MNEQDGEGAAMGEQGEGVVAEALGLVTEGALYWQETASRYSREARKLFAERNAARADLDAATARAEALTVALSELASATIEHASPPGTTLWRSSCLVCTSAWWDYEPEPRHSEGCPVERARALLGAEAAPRPDPPGHGRE